jgi:hypothetical protein
MRRKPAPPSPPEFSLYQLARDEIGRWRPEMRGFALAVLFCFIHRLTTGKSYEESFGSQSNSRNWSGWEI